MQNQHLPRYYKVDLLIIADFYPHQMSLWKGAAYRHVHKRTHKLLVLSAGHKQHTSNLVL
ncbi:hypothetical protein SAMN05428977_102341 [Nitrosomonas sp. Nm166]|nr:hypothetical protein SAMN05428977_102341 [Nitrosomonas sp. Nm166]